MLDYDQVFLNIPLNAENARKFVTTLITNAGYPDPNGFNPNRVGGPVTPTPSTVRFSDAVAARSSLPYNQTTGADDNRDTQTNDRPAARSPARCSLGSASTSRTPAPSRCR